jgi:hypothetical protein
MPDKVAGAIELLATQVAPVVRWFVENSGKIIKEAFSGFKRS